MAKAKKEGAAPKKAVKKAAKKEKAFTYDEEYIEGIIEKMENIMPDLRKGVTVAAAAKRARLTSSELTKLFKEFRAMSVQAFKKE